MELFHRITILGFALMLMSIVFIVDINTTAALNLGSLYCLVLFYSWIIKGKYATVLLAILSTILIIVDIMVSSANELHANFSFLNSVISILVVWLVAISMIIAKRNYSSFEEAQTRLEDEFEKVNAINLELKEKNVELEQLTYVASHDLNEPLRTITSFIDMFQNEFGDELNDRGNQYLRYIKESSTRLSDLIRDLLVFSLVGRSKELEYTDLNKMLDEILVDLSVITTENKAQITVEILPSIFSFATDLRLVFQNLITNAIKFKKEDGYPIIHVGSRELSNHWEFYVQDNGIGIEESDLNKIFLFFQRLHHRDKFKGTGIGLANCKKIVDFHDGNIWVESQPNVGSTFYFSVSKDIH